MTTVFLVDETTTGERSPRRAARVGARVTLRELLRRRVAAEVSDGARWWMRPGRTDVHTEYERALAAFARNGFVVLVGERQVTDLDAVLELAPDTEVVFLRLVPLAGG